MNDSSDIYAEVADYYSDKLAEYGTTPQGVDWNGMEGQLLRFQQLCSVVEFGSVFSINDIGCGYGALIDYLRQSSAEFRYCGIDISRNMIEVASKKYDGDDIRFVAASQPDTIADYSVASGIFNVCQNRSVEEWKAYILSTLEILDRFSKRGFAFNCLTSYSDKDKMHDYLYYADPCELFDYCKNKYSRDVALLHDYGLYEFTILVRKS